MYKCNNKHINIIKSAKERTKIPLWKLITDGNKEKEQLEAIDSQIKIRISLVSILPGSSIAKATKQKLIMLLVSPILVFADHNALNSTFNPKSDKNQYTPNSLSNDQFNTNNKSNDRSNNAVITIKKRFLNIEHRLSYKRLTKKIV